MSDSSAAIVRITTAASAADAAANSNSSNTTSTAAAAVASTIKPWPKEQNWIKDVLSKSGTELVKLSSNSSLKITKKTIKHEEKESKNNTMVYYQSMPLIIKSEQPSQAQLCAPLRNSHLEQVQQHQQQTTYATINNVALNLQSHQQQLHQLQSQHQQLSQNSSINHHQQQHQQQPQHQHQHQQHSPQQQYLANIKTELLPPGITLYATTPQSATSLQQQQQTIHTQQQQLVAGSSNTISSTTPHHQTATTVRKTNPNKPQFKCEQCGMTFGSKSAHTSHTKSHAKNGELSMLSSANAAGAIAGTTALEVNEAGVPLGIPKTPQLKPNATVNGGDPYQCNVCQKTFAVPARLIRHYRTHTGERPFECEFCHKLFSVKENLQVHRRIHTKERPYKCDVCGRAFEHSGKLHRHMRIHTGERPHKCSVCEKTFIQSGQLVIHMRTHTGEKPYKCPVEGCGKGFTCSKQLKVHSRTHTGEKPYHCDICFRDFGYNHVLKLHKVQHYGSKCYKCTICDETFKSKKEMESHIKGHANELPDDDEESAAAAAANAQATTSLSSAVSTSSGAETNSAPNSPQSPTTSVPMRSTNTPTTAISAKVKKMRKEKSTIGRAITPPSPGSSHSAASMSPSSSYVSASRLSAGSPTSSVASPTMSLTLESSDHHSRDSGVASGSMPTANSRHNMAAVSLLDMSSSNSHASYHIAEEMPTDLSVSHQQHQQHQLHHQQQMQHQQHNQQHLPEHLQQYHYQGSLLSNHHNHQAEPQYHNLTSRSSPVDMPSHLGQQQQQHQQHQQHHMEQHTINPALLEAATIASRREDNGLHHHHHQHHNREDDVQQAAIQIMQLRRSQHKSNANQSNSNSATFNNLHQLAPMQHSLITPLNRTTSQASSPALLMSNAESYDDDQQEANDLIDHYKRGDLARHGLAKGYAPVPKFEPSLHNNEIIRQVEAAIAPLRQSTESPDRSSSPESDSIMLMADRDVSTLPLRKRKLYMSDVDAVANDESAASNINNKDGLGSKVMRHNSVIQFAKAS